MRNGWGVWCGLGALALMACSNGNDCGPTAAPDSCGATSCAQGFYCVSDAGPPTCTAAKPLGAPCSRGAECVTLLCMPAADGGLCTGCF
jgi:hypothetical protein